MQNRNNYKEGHAFQGKHFFLDIDPDSSTFKALQKRIEALGGFVDRTFTDNISIYVNFDKSNLSSKNKKEDGTTHKTSIPLFKRALQSNIEIKTLERLMKTLNDYEKANQLGMVTGIPGKTSLLKTMALRTPFIKIEDFTLNFRPIFYEMMSLPAILIEYFVKSSPFYYPHRTSAINHAKSANKNCDNQPPPPNFVGFLHSSGYCEICDKEFRHIHYHINSKSHFDFAANNSNYADIDAAINVGFYRDQREPMNSKCERMFVITDLASAMLPTGLDKNINAKTFVRFNPLKMTFIYHHPGLHQGLITFYTQKKNFLALEPVAIEYLHIITKDSAIHPEIFSISNINVSNNNYKYGFVPVCIIEASCFISALSINLPSECHDSGAKIDLFLFPSPDDRLDVVFALYTFALTSATGGNMSLLKMTSFSSGPTDSWCVQTVINAIKSIQFSPYK